MSLKERASPCADTVAPPMRLDTCCGTEEHHLGTVALATHRFDMLQQSAADARTAPRRRDDYVLDDAERLAAIHGVEAYAEEERTADDSIHATDKQRGVRGVRYGLQAFWSDIDVCILHEGSVQCCNHCRYNTPPLLALARLRRRRAQPFTVDGRSR